MKKKPEPKPLHGINQKVMITVEEPSDLKLPEAFNNEDDYKVEPEIPDGHLSFSRIYSFLFCAFKFYLTYVKRETGTVSFALLLGRGFHSGMEYGLKKMVQTTTPETDRVVEVAVSKLEKDFDFYSGRIETSEFDLSLGTAKDDLSRMMTPGFDFASSNFKPKADGIEKFFQFPLDSEADVHGRIDMEETNHIGDGLTDFKTTTRKPDALTVMDWQMVTYELSKSAEKAYQWLKKFYVVRHKNKARDISLYQYLKPRTPRSVLDDVLRSISAVKEQIKTASVSGYPKTTDLSKCSWCQYRMKCRPDIFGNENIVERYIKKELVFTTSPKLKSEVI